MPCNIRQAEESKDRLIALLDATTMMGDLILDRVQAIVTRVAGPQRTPPEAGHETPLREGGFWLDSLDLLDVIVACEKEFGIVFDATSDLSEETMRTVGSLAGVVRVKWQR